MMTDIEMDEAEDQAREEALALARRAAKEERLNHLVEDLTHLAGFLDQNREALLDLDAEVYGGNFTVYAPYLPDLAADATEEQQAERREVRRVWLGRVAQLKRPRGSKLEKSSSEYGYTVKVPMPHGRIGFEGYVSSDQVCVYVESEDETEEVEEVVETVVRKKTVPKRVKHCPPSLLAGVLDEVEG